MHREFEEMQALYALGTLDGEERTRFERHAAECIDCARAVKEFSEASAGVALSLAPARPSDGLRSRVLERARPSNVVSMRRMIMAIAALIIAALIGVVAFQSHELQTVRAELEARMKMESMLRDPLAQVVSLKGGEPSPGSSGRVLWKGRDLVFMGSRLPPLPARKIYELWAIVDKKPVPAGLFGVDAAGNVIGSFTFHQDLARVDAFALTLEPEGGLEAPSGKMFLVPN
jgi:anti-sigma-K factor RskA